MSQESTLADYVGYAKGASPESFLAQHSYPVLLQRLEDSEDSGADYHTQMIAPGTTPLELSRGLATQFAMRVIPIRKRPGGAFPDRVGVGRTRNTDIPLLFAQVSKYHAFFTVEEGSGLCYLTDAGSKNGTFIDSEQLVPKQKTALSDRSIISFAEHHFRFHTAAGFYKVIDLLTG